MRFGRFLAAVACFWAFSGAWAAERNVASEKVREIAGQLEGSLLKSFPDKKRMRLGVVDLENVTEGAQRGKLGKIFSELISGRLAESGRFVIIERQKLRDVLEEQSLSMTGLLDPASVKTVGRLLAADAIVCGSVSELGDYYQVSVRAIDVERGNVMATAVSTLPKSAVDGTSVGVGRGPGSEQLAIQRDIDYLEAALVNYGNTNVDRMRVIWPAKLEDLVPRYLNRIPVPAAGRWVYDPRDGSVRNSAYPDIKPSMPRLNTQTLLDHAQKAKIMSVLHSIRTAAMMYQMEHGSPPPNINAMRSMIASLPEGDGTWEYDPKTRRIWNSKYPAVVVTLDPVR
jgi:TolB-like protein